MCYIVRAQDRDSLYSCARRFVQPFEILCCALMEQIVSKDKNVYLILSQSSIDAAVVKGVFTYGERGVTVLSCLPYRDDEVKKCLMSFFRGKSVFCLSGDKDYVDFLSCILLLTRHKKPSDVREMFFMTYDDRRKKVSHAGGDYDILLCRSDYIDELMPLQTDYMQKEVMPCNTKVSPAAERLYLEKCINKCNIYVLMYKGHIVSKVHFNAQSPLCNQLGGVYTLGDYRGRGYAGYLIEYMTELGLKQGKQTVLFVKENNESAIKCYTRCGFIITGRYSIVYYL